MNKCEEKFFDTHVHLDLLGDPLEAEGLMDEAQGAGVDRFLVPGVSPERWSALMTLCSGHENVWAAPGIHPQLAHLWGTKTARQLEGLLGHDRVVSIGEIGLDSHLPRANRQEQEGAFVGQLRLALEADLPVVIHCRGATQRLLEILRREGAERVGGFFHAFSGSVETAREAVALGFAIGLGGTLTYPNARRSPQVARELDARWLVLETDAPDLAPHPYRGQSNRPAWLTLVAQALAAERGWDLTTTARTTSANARRVLRLD